MALNIIATVELLGQGAQAKFKSAGRCVAPALFIGTAQGAGRLALWWLAACLGISSVAQANCNANIPLTRPNSRYEAVAAVTPAGSEVRDKVTGLIWQRCVLGMVWNGTTCTGTASRLTLPQALDAARAVTPSTVPGATAWRVPKHDELYGLAERACLNPAINTTWFPATPTDWVWSSSPDSDASGYAWLVYFYDGYDYYDYKNYAYRARLVRSGR